MLKQLSSIAKRVSAVKDEATKAAGFIERKAAELADKNMAKATTDTIDSQFGSTYRPFRQTAPSLKDGFNDYFTTNQKHIDTNPENYSIPDRYKFTGYGKALVGGTVGLLTVDSMMTEAFDRPSYRGGGTATPVVSASQGLTPQNAFDNMGASGDINFALRRNNIKAPGTL